MKEGPDRIDSLDLEVVKRKLTLPPEAGGYGWPAADSEEAIRSYRAFLKRVRTYRAKTADCDGDLLGHGPSPDPVTDIVWHTHILFTEKYHRDCAALFGAYIHHRPRVEADAAAGHPPAGA